MRLIRSFLTLLLLTVATMVAAQEPQVVVVDGRKCLVHNIAEGETLYSLARAYDVPLKSIVELNGDIDAVNISLGQAIYIPLSSKAPKRGKTEITKGDIDPFIEHTIAAGDTFYSIAKHYKIDLGVLMADNEGITPESLSLGNVIKIRKECVGKGSLKDINREERLHATTADVVRGDVDELFTFDAAVEEANLVVEDDDLLVSFEVEECRDDVDSTAMEVVEAVNTIRIPKFKRFQKGEVLNVALMISMNRNDKPVPAFVDFYRGTLLALEDLRREGYSINVNVYDTKLSAEHTREIVESEGFANTDLIIGPIYANEIAEVVPFAEEHNIPLVSPLSDIDPEQVSSPVLFQMKADGKYHYEKYADMLDGSYDVTIIYGGNGNDDNYLKEVLAATSHLKVTSLVATAPAGIPRLCYRKSDGTSGSSVPITSLLQENGRSLVFIVASEDMTVQRVLEAIGEEVMIRQNGSRGCVVAGSSKWDNLKYMDFKGMFQCGVSTIMPYNIKRVDNNAIQIFESRYLNAFGNLPTAFSGRGYDAMMLFCTKMFTGLDKSILVERITPLATPYTFKFEDGMFVNTEWVVAEYQRNFTIIYK